MAQERELRHVLRTACGFLAPRLLAALLEVNARTIEQMRLANALGRFA